MPKKDSEDYKAVRALIASGDVTADSAVSAAAAPLEKKVRKVSKRKESAAAPAKHSAETPAKPDGTTLLDQPHIDKQAIAEVVPDAEKKPVKKRAPKAIQRDGETPQMNHLKALTEQNSGMAIVPADYPGLKGQIEKVLEVRPEGIPESKKKVETAEIMLSKSTEGKTAPDMKAIEGRAPFSFSAIRQMLRQ
jgi:hypothetical protein